MVPYLVGKIAYLYIMLLSINLRKEHYYYKILFIIDKVILGLIFNI